jgi:RNA polymerase sigma factor (sigma-70 family)
MKTDAELLGRYVNAESHAAFAELVQRHIALVYGAALRLVGGDAHLAEDVVQTVFTALARKARSLQQRSSLSGWLYLSTHHAAAQFIRTEGRRRKREEAHAMQEHLTRSETTSEWEHIRPVLDAAMRELSDPDREAVLLRYFQQQPFARIGAALNVSEDAARMRVERALDKLRGVLGRRGITSASTALGSVLVSQACVMPSVQVLAQASAAASAACASAAMGSLLTMNTKLALVSTMAAGAIGIASYQGYQAQRATAEIALMAKQRDEAVAAWEVARRSAGELEERMAQAAGEAAALRHDAESRRASAQTAPAAGNSTASPEGIGTWSGARVDGTHLGSFHFVDTPEGRYQAIRQAVGETFPALFRKMGWTEQQQEQFKRLYFERKEAEKQLLDEVLARGAPPNRETARQVVQEAGREFEAKLRGALGENAPEALRDFEAKRPFRAIADEVAKRLLYSDAPLSHWQAEQLIDAMANNASMSQGRFDLGTMNRDTVLAQAGGVLSVAQLAVFREVEAERRRQHEFEQRILAERGRNPPETTSPPGR